MRIHPNAVGNLLRSLEGDWEGSGVGEYPTIETFHYRETMSIWALTQDALRYEQQTWRVASEGEVPSHHEIGFLGAADDGTLTMTSAHGLDRLEAMTGHVRESPWGLVLTLTSTSFAHDERMIKSWRKWVVTSNHIHYDMGMATESTPEGAHHLSADLFRLST